MIRAQSGRIGLRALMAAMVIVGMRPPQLTAEVMSLPDRLDASVFSSPFPWKRQIRTTTFYIGQSALASVPGSSASRNSAWDRNWMQNFGGTDHPRRREGFRPVSFTPKMNPFYVALPFNDLAYPSAARRFVPWYGEKAAWAAQTRHKSVLKGQWIAIHYGGRVCFAQWEDVGPWNANSPDYVFGNARPRGRAGLDVSPSVRDFLRFPDTANTDWRFVDASEVPEGPWLQYGNTRSERSAEVARLGRDPKRTIVTQKKFTETVGGNEG